LIMGSQIQPLVSVLTPVYNTERYLAECIESVLAQTYDNWEYIIVNNCSTDGTLDIAKAFTEKDPRIRIHNNKEFVDIITNHNLAFRQISTESKYCKIVSADDWLFSDCIKQMVNLAETNPTVGIVGSYTLHDEDIGNVGLPYPSTVVPGKDICRRSLLGGPYVFGAPTGLLYRSELVRNAKAFFPNLSPHADTAACYEHLQHCDFGFVHQILAYVRIHTGQTSERSRQINRYIAEHLRYLVQYGPIYLTKEELDNRLAEHMSTYYKFLAKNLFRGGDDEFWDYHKMELKERGYALDRLKLAKAAMFQVMDAVFNPKRTIEGLLS
jgi:glycosyltransferase involved in cell wall biosynthesis